MLLISFFVGVFLVSALFLLGYWAEVQAWVFAALFLIGLLILKTAFGPPDNQLVLTWAVFLGCIAIAGLGAAARAIEKESNHRRR